MKTECDIYNFILGLAGVVAVVLGGKRRHHQVGPGAVAVNHVVPVKVLAADLHLVVPPGDGGVGDRGGCKGHN